MNYAENFKLAQDLQRDRMDDPLTHLYTLDDITRLYSEYYSKRVIRVLKGGKWEIIPLTGKGIPQVGGTRAEQVELHKVMDFPEFLKEQHGS